MLPVTLHIYQMGFQPDPISTPPKLSLFSLPSKAATLQDGLTPPPHTMATIPFLWEEAPGKPRPTTSDPPKSKTVRSLELPPRLSAITAAGTGPTNDGKNSVRVEIIPSPTTVLGGPYEGVYPSKSLSGSPEKVVVIGRSSKSKGKMPMPLRKLMRKDRSPVKFSSWRCGSFSDLGGGSSVGREGKLPSCSWRWDSFRDKGGGNGEAGGRGGGGPHLSSSFDDLQKCVDSDIKMGKVTRKGSFTFSNGTATSAFLASMYGTLKGAVTWGRR